MSWRLAPLVALFVLACGSGKMKVKKGEPQTAREKMLAEEKTKQGSDDDEPVKPPGSKQWKGWRYQGERKDCFFLVGKRCFKTQKAACAAAKCKAPAKCATEGAGPAQLSCSTVASDDREDDKAEDKKEDAKKPAKKKKKKSSKKKKS